VASTKYEPSTKNIVRASVVAATGFGGIVLLVAFTPSVEPELVVLGLAVTAFLSIARAEALETRDLQLRAGAAVAIAISLLGAFSVVASSDAFDVRRLALSAVVVAWAWHVPAVLANAGDDRALRRFFSGIKGRRISHEVSELAIMGSSLIVGIAGAKNFRPWDEATSNLVLATVPLLVVGTYFERFKLSQERALTNSRYRKRHAFVARSLWSRIVGFGYPAMMALTLATTAGLAADNETNPSLTIPFVLAGAAGTAGLLGVIAARRPSTDESIITLNRASLVLILAAAGLWFGEVFTLSGWHHLELGVAAGVWIAVLVLEDLLVIAAYAHGHRVDRRTIATAAVVAASIGAVMAWLLSRAFWGGGAGVGAVTAASAILLVLIVWPGLGVFTGMAMLRSGPPDRRSAEEPYLHLVQDLSVYSLVAFVAFALPVELLQAGVCRPHPAQATSIAIVFAASYLHVFGALRRHWARGRDWLAPPDDLPAAARRLVQSHSVLQVVMLTAAVAYGWLWWSTSTCS
jgi:hypothetical protein